MNRRSFLRFATLLGASVPVAYALAGCTPEAPPTGGAAGGSTAAEPAAAGGIVRGDPCALVCFCNRLTIRRGCLG
ncbi:MAG: hypothetical protein R2932_35135 [Caldilineaceae bacterium]